MELMQSESDKNLYEKCKYKVKFWEHTFTKQHGRLPSRLDIKEASTEVRNAYKKYFQLKSKALEQSFMDVEGFNSDNEEIENDTTVSNKESDVKEVIEVEEPEIVEPKKEIWGLHLNKNTSTPVQSDKNKPKTPANANLSQKLFVGSKFAKRNPRKSLATKSESHIAKDKSSFLSQQSFSESQNDSYFLSQPETSFKAQQEEPKSEEINEFEPLVNFSNLAAKAKIVAAVKKVNSTPTNLFQNGATTKLATHRSVDLAWLERIENVTSQNQNIAENKINNATKVDLNDSDISDVVDASDEEEDNRVVHIAKKIKISTSVTISQVQNPEDEEKPRVKPMNNFNYNFENEYSNNIKTFEPVEKIEKPLENEKPHEETKKAVHKIPQTDTEKETSKLLQNIHNQNFRRIDLKKKVYARGKSNFTFSKYKKQQWKNKRAAMLHVDLIPDNAGPYVKKKKQQVDNLLPLESFVENPDTLMTLKQAFNIENGIVEEEESSEINDNPEDILEANENASDHEDSNAQNLEQNNDESSLESLTKPTRKPKKSPQITKKPTKPKKTNTSQNSTEVTPKTNRPKRQATATPIYNNFDSSSEPDPYEDDDSDTFSIEKFKKANRKNKINDDSDTSDETTESSSVATTISQEIKSKTSRKVIGASKPKNVVKQVRKPKAPSIEPSKPKAVAKATRSKTNKKTVPEKELPPSQEIQKQPEQVFDFEDNFTDDLVFEMLKLEEKMGQPKIGPLYKLNDDGSMIPTPPDVYNALSMFGHSSFRPGQEQAIMRILSGQSTLVTLSTGSGKSLCYQLPAFMFSQRQKCISLVISPLVSLMEDQVKGIPGFLKAACLHTSQTKVQRENIIKSIIAGEISVLLISPEAVVSSNTAGFGSILMRLPPIAFACIDEAHCLSQWSHNFRPSYLIIARILQEGLGVKTILGLTATATKATLNSLIGQLNIPDPINGVISDIPVPNNLTLGVSEDFNRDQALVELLLSEKYQDLKSIIIYCTRREECERIAAFLRTCLKKPTSSQTEPSANKKRKRMSLEAEPYHAGLPSYKRRTLQKSFMSGELRIVVATIAFGMGINKADIRAVIHYNMPPNFEGYVQEIGRAGRDGLPAHCHVFLDKNDADRNEHRRHIYGNSMDRHIIRKLLKKVFKPCSCTTQCPKHEVLFPIESIVQLLDVPKENIATLLCYLELHEKEYIKMLKPAYAMCKILSYSGEEQFGKSAASCRPLAVAVSKYGKKERTHANVLEFPVIDVAQAIGIDSGSCKRELKELEWTKVNNLPKRSTLTVQFYDLGYHLMAPGNLNDAELDEALVNLYKRVVDQENTSYSQLIHIHETLKEVSCSSYKKCALKESENTEKLKLRIRDYFDSEKMLEKVPEPECSPEEEQAIISDVKALVCRYSDSSFTGRAIARIFHGIGSPNYPPIAWGRCNFWRRHIKIHFNVICRIATQALIKM